MTKWGRPSTLSDRRDQRHGGGGRTDLGARDHVEEHVALALPGRSGIDPRQVGRRLALLPGAGAAEPGLDLGKRIAGLDLLARALQAPIGEIGRHIGDRWIFVAVGEDDGDRMLARERDELRHEEALMAHLDGVAKLQAILLLRQERKEGAEILLLELLGRRELPQDRPELLPELGEPAPEEALDR